MPCSRPTTTRRSFPVRVAWRVPHLQARTRAAPARPGARRSAASRAAARGLGAACGTGDRAHCLVGASATIGELRRRFAGQVAGAEHGERHAFARFVARAAAVTLDIEERGIQGSRYKVPRFVADHILASPEFRPALERIADGAGSSAGGPAGGIEALPEGNGVHAERRSSSTCARSSIASCSRAVTTGGRALIRRNSSGCARRMRTHPTVLLFTHKTYIDASLPTLLLYSNDLPMLHTFGGINMDFAGFGTLVRRSGGIFIRRSFQDNRGLQARAAQVRRLPAGEALPDVVGARGHALAPRQADAATLRPAQVHARCRARCRDRERAHLPVRHQFRPDPRRRGIRRRADRPGEEARVASSGSLGYVRVAAPAHGSVRVDLGEPVVVRQAPSPDDKLALAKIAFEVAVQANRVTPLT